MSFEPKERPDFSKRVNEWTDEQKKGWLLNAVCKSGVISVSKAEDYEANYDLQQVRSKLERILNDWDYPLPGDNLQTVSVLMGWLH